MQEKKKSHQYVNLKIYFKNSYPFPSNGRFFHFVILLIFFTTYLLRAIIQDNRGLEFDAIEYGIIEHFHRFKGKLFKQRSHSFP